MRFGTVPGTEWQLTQNRYGAYVCVTYQKQGASACPGSRVAVGNIEGFVVDKIRAIGRDPELAAEAVRAAREEVEARRPPLESELRLLERDGRRLGGERANLVAAVGRGGDGTDALVERLAEVDIEAGKADARAGELRAELAGLEAAVVDDADLRAALARFDPAWAELTVRERRRVLELLVEEVRYDGVEGEVEVRFRASGIKALADRARPWVAP